jgi:hypothetical protein
MPRMGCFSPRMGCFSPRMGCFSPSRCMLLECLECSNTLMLKIIFKNKKIYYFNVF